MAEKTKETKAAETEPAATVPLSAPLAPPEGFSETVPGGRYIFGDVVKNAHGEVIEGLSVKDGEVIEGLSVKDGEVIEGLSVKDGEITGTEKKKN